MTFRFDVSRQGPERTSACYKSLHSEAGSRRVWTSCLAGTGLCWVGVKVMSTTPALKVRLTLQVAWLLSCVLQRPFFFSG